MPKTKLRSALAEALWEYVSADQLADVCGDKGVIISLAGTRSGPDTAAQSLGIDV